MLSKIFLSACLMYAATAGAQAGQAQPAGKTAAERIEYRLNGSPMPPLVLATWHDTGTYKVMNTEGMTARERKKVRKDIEAIKADHDKPVITNADLNNDANLLVMIFSPSCSHCENQTDDIIKHADMFKKSKLVMVAANAQKPYLPSFINNLHIRDYPFIYIGTDSTDFTLKTYLYQALPQIDIYDHNRRLIKTYTGGQAMDTLKKYIE